MTVSRVRLAVALWVVCAIVVWNVVFDRVIVLAGRQYVHAAAVAANGSGPYERIDDWMPAAVTRGLWIASGSAGLLLIVSLAAIRFAVRRGRARPEARTEA